ncbi:MAG: PHP domain-containing protein [Clostridiales Family XIII bacterium]|nr:PHP domain-containing protein [Clostridiales Family XIII bacterium]
MKSYEENYRIALEFSQGSAEGRLEALRRAVSAQGAQDGMGGAAAHSAQDSMGGAAAHSAQGSSGGAAAEFVNNHIHSIYSFSPYSPTAAAYAAKLNGLTTVGIMDHDSVAGAHEFLEACGIVGIGATVGFECRVDMGRTPFAGRRINNPDQDSVAYMACHGIPHHNIGKAQEWLRPYRESRRLRSQLMTERLNGLLSGTGLRLSFEGDVAAISQAQGGGVITERHILFALARQIVKAFGRGRGCLDFISKQLALPLGANAAAALLDAGDPLYEYRMLGTLKAHLVGRFYIDAGAECPDAFEFLEFASAIGAISAYPYLGDVADSVTGDKTSACFEDGYLDELIAWLAREGFNAVTYMPARNSAGQLERIMRLAGAAGLFQISGEDINAPFQPFVCEMLAKPAFRHLADSAWALIGHEKAASRIQPDAPGQPAGTPGAQAGASQGRADKTGRLTDAPHGMFSPETIKAWPGLEGRIGYFAKLGRGQI